MLATRRSIGILRPENAVLFLCDIQEKFRPLIYESETLIRRSLFVHDICKVLHVPTIVTEHYREIFGPTVSDFHLENDRVFQKRLFSMMTEEVTEYLATINKQQVLLCGIESHVCVLQTAMDLIDQGKEVHIVCDAVSSQRVYDRTVALERMKEIGVHFTTSESVMFQLLKTATHPQFKACVKLLKEANLGPNEFANKSTL